MADVQLEHGHIRIANALFRAVMLAKLSGSARRVLLECLSRQYGWARPKDAPRPFAAAPASVGKAIGCARETASRALSALVRQRVLRAVGDHAYLIEKDFDRWVCGFHGDPDHVHWTPAGDRDQTVTQRDEMITPPCDETVTPSVIKRSRPRDQTVTPAPARTSTPSAFAPSLEPVLQPREPERENARATGDARKWSIHGLREHLGDRRLSPPAIQVPRWVGIMENNSDAEIDAALTLCGGKDRPLSYFLALFDEQGRRLKDARQKTRTPRLRRPLGYVRPPDYYSDG